MSTNDKPSRVPPYTAFPTFSGFIETLSKTALPGQIDRSIMPKMSGVTQSHLLSALRYLGLVNEEGVVNPGLRTLVKAYGTKTWAVTLAEIIGEAYTEIVGEMDLDTATQKQLFDAFKTKGHVDGQMLTKAVRFYIRALESAALTFSPHFKVRKPRTARAPKPKTEAGGKNPESKLPNPPAPIREINSPPAGLISFPLHLPGKASGSVWVPENLTVEDCEILESMMPTIRVYAKQRNAARKH